jgi:glycosyltransferase involved in cell wall biosynthesis
MTPGTTNSSILLVLRTPPPYGGGEIVARIIRDAFRGSYSILEFTRPRHSKGTQGRFSVDNFAFGIYYTARTSWTILRRKPRVVYMDISKEFVPFLRSIPILMVCSLRGVRVVGDLAGAYFQFLETPGWKRRLGQMSLTRAWAIRVLSPSLAQRLEMRGLHNAVSFSNGFDPPPGIPPGERPFPETPRFLYVGTINASKGILVLLDFLEEYRAGGGTGHLDIVGEWESEEIRSQVLDRVRERNLAGLVTFHGLLVGEEKWKRFREATVLIHPSTWDGQPVTILEALAFGIPVVATPVGAIPDTIVHGADGYVMQERTGLEALRGVRAILADPATYARFSRTAREAYRTKYRREVFVDHLQTLLEQTLRGESYSTQQKENNRATIQH